MNFRGIWAILAKKNKSPSRFTTKWTQITLFTMKTEIIYFLVLRYINYLLLAALVKSKLSKLLCCYRIWLESYFK